MVRVGLAELIALQFLAIVNVLERKGFMTKEEYNEEFKKLEEERLKKKEED